MAEVSAGRVTDEILAGSYGRISKARGKPGDPETTAGVRRQHEENAGKAESLGWRIAERYTDNDITASGKARRPEFERLLSDLEKRRINALIVWHLDRLLRIRGDLDRLVRICQQRKVLLVTVRAGNFDVGTASGQLLLDLLTAVSTYELGHGAERLRAKHEQLAREGKPNGGPRAFGFEPGHLAIRPAEAEVIREASKRCLAGESLRSIALDLHRRGVPTAQGGAWTSRSLWQILTKASIAGQREVFTADEDGRKPAIGTVVGKAVWPPIISVRESNKLRRLLGDPGRRSKPGVTSSPLLLTGLLFCGVCHHRMESAGRSSAGRVMMRCRKGVRGCGKTGVDIHPLQEHIEAAVLRRLDGGLLAQLMTAADDSGLHSELAEVESDLAALASEWALKRITRQEWLAARPILEARRTTLSEQIERGQRTQGLAGLPNPLTPEWPHLTVPAQRTAISLVLERIEVWPARHEGDRIVPRWKH